MEVIRQQALGGVKLDPSGLAVEMQLLLADVGTLPVSAPESPKSQTDTCNRLRANSLTLLAHCANVTKGIIG